MSQKEDLEAEITREELCLAELRIKIAATTTRLAELRRQLAAEALVQVVTPWKLAPPIAGTPATNAAKVALFRSLFRGREDVFPRRWENVKKGKSGYAPACDNEWAHGLCEKKRSLGAGRRATCGECSNQAFIAVSNKEIAKHLRGDHVMGVYPLLTDETCWFLAADFDDKTWQEDAAAFAETCELLGIEVVLERSRSGNGLHPILHMQLGPVRFAVDAQNQDARRPFAQKLIVRETDSCPSDSRRTRTYRNFIRHSRRTGAATI